MKTFFGCKFCGGVRFVETPEEQKDEFRCIDTCGECFSKHLDYMHKWYGGKSYKNLKTLLNGYNAYDFLFEDGGVTELGKYHDFRFTVNKMERGTKITVWDAMEQFYQGIDDEISAIASQAAKDLGLKIKNNPTNKEAKTLAEIEEAIAKDLGVKSVELEWEDSVVLSAYISH